MKKLFILSLLLVYSMITSASSLFLLPTGSVAQTKQAFNLSGIIIHYYNDEYVIGSTNGQLPDNSILLAENAWNEDAAYYILFNHPDQMEDYVKMVSSNATILHRGNDFLIISAGARQSAGLSPAVHGGMIRITNDRAKFPPASLDYRAGSIQYRDDISDMIAQVDIDTLEAYVQHLQDFGTRNAYKAGGILAQDWILSKFLSYGLSVELHDFSMPGGPASDNVIATLPGTVYPDEYVILGAHYDSYAGSSNEPGADDNATGTAGILEAARIMSQYQFDRTIIFATWSGEEYGLYGSAAWASQAADNGMNILGYFNIDMAGYLEPGNPIHTDIIAPSSANELRQFYKDVCAVYLPDFQVFDGTLSGGDSDHTSFNNNGFQGIFPFEDSQDYSPYIHTGNDLIGPSVNNFEQHMTFVQAIIANVASMSSQLPSPENLVAQAGDQQVVMNWDIVEGAASFNIYRNSAPEPFTTVFENSFTDNDVINGTSYTYYVTAIFEDSGEESGPSNVVTVIPMPPISLPFFDDFETGAPYWTMEDSWGLQSGVYYSSLNALTESPNGAYAADLDISTTLRALNFTSAYSAEVSFWTRYSLESDYDYMYLEVSTDGINWNQIDSYNGQINNWTLKTYSLDDYLDETNVIIRFRFSSDEYVEEDGMYIDDLEVKVTGVGMNDDIASAHKTNLKFNPNPASDHVSLIYWLETSGNVKISLTDAKGGTMKVLENSWKETGEHRYEFDADELSAGVYYGILEIDGQKVSRKLVLTK